MVEGDFFVDGFLAVGGYGVGGGCERHSERVVGQTMKLSCARLGRVTSIV